MGDGYRDGVGAYNRKMAKPIPTLNSVLPRMAAGEKRFGRRLESHLEGDYLCWYDNC